MAALILSLRRRRLWWRVRFIVGISLLVLGVGMLSCRVEGVGAQESERPRASAWVRTVDGWERSDRWTVTPAWEPGVHPLVVAAGQSLVSVMALVALGGNPNVRGRETRAQRPETRAQRALGGGGRRC
jgi:hypothetical protein